MNIDTVMVLTARSIERMVKEGGSQAWRLRASHARQMEYIVCTRNQRASWGDGHEAHRSGFLVAKVRDVVPSPERPERSLVRFSKYARIEVPELWHKGDTNPVRYDSLVDLGIDPQNLNWEDMPSDEEGEAATTPEPAPATAQPHQVRPLTISEAKHGLSLAFKVPLDAVEITIRA